VDLGANISQVILNNTLSFDFIITSQHSTPECVTVFDISHNSAVLVSPTESIGHILDKNPSSPEDDLVGFKLLHLKFRRPHHEVDEGIFDHLLTALG
jgi:hypothetical protein